MAGHRIRALAGVILAGASLALAACTSGASGASGTPGPPAVRGATVAVKDGKVVVMEGNKVICTMTVVNGKGTCKVPATTFGVGTSKIVATYNGPGYRTGRSAPQEVTVVEPTTTTTLTLSPATVTYGQEQAGHLTVRVAPQQGAGMPTGAVVVESGRVTVCVIRLSGGAGTCTLPAAKLSVGTHALTAIYGGDSSYQGSDSAARTLSVK
jgi:Bacterial Ig-like domain (group 3)